jgi:hypothetical protein
MHNKQLIYADFLRKEVGYGRYQLDLLKELRTGCYNNILLESSTTDITNEVNSFFDE